MNTKIMLEQLLQLVKLTERLAARDEDFERRIERLENAPQDARKARFSFANILAQWAAVIVALAALVLSLKK